MKGKMKLAVAFLAIVLVFGSFLVFVSPIGAHPTDQPEGDENTNTESYVACGGIQGCRTSCGCGCLGNPNACGCGG